jgi:hypothetical protein
MLTPRWTGLRQAAPSSSHSYDARVLATSAGTAGRRDDADQCCGIGRRNGLRSSLPSSVAGIKVRAWYSVGLRQAAPARISPTGSRRATGFGIRLTLYTPGLGADQVATGPHAIVTTYDKATA